MLVDKDKHITGRNSPEICTIEDLVPAHHIVRAVDASVDWGRIYDSVEALYNADIGRPGVDPVVLIKIVLIQHIFRLRSLRQTVSEIEINLAYRWFIGYSLLEKIPHFSTVSANFVHRIKGELFDSIFADVIDEVISGCGLPPESLIYESPYLRRGASYDRLMNKYLSIDDIVQMTFEAPPRAVSPDAKKYDSDDIDEDTVPKSRKIEALYSDDELSNIQISLFD